LVENLPPCDHGNNRNYGNTQAGFDLLKKKKKGTGGLKKGSGSNVRSPGTLKQHLGHRLAKGVKLREINYFFHFKARLWDAASSVRWTGAVGSEEASGDRCLRAFIYMHTYLHRLHIWYIVLPVDRRNGAFCSYRAKVTGNTPTARPPSCPRPAGHLCGA